MDERAPDRTSDTGQSPPSPSLTAREAAAQAGVNERTIRRAINRGDLAAFKRGGVFNIARSELDQYLRRRSRPGGKDPDRIPDRAGRALATVNHAPRDQPAEADPSDRHLRLVPLIDQRQRQLTGPPRPLTALIGRDREAAEVGALLRRDDLRLLTLTGPGGIGKTRLAIRVATEFERDVAVGVGFVPLAPIGSADLVIPAIAQAVHGRESSGDFSLERLRLALGEQPVLLVLDNFEHLMPAAVIVADLLASCPLLKVLVTSRAALRLSGEQEYLVPPLSLPGVDEGSPAIDQVESDAVRLFVRRAQAARPSFALSPGNAPAVRTMCRLLDGLPLAIELAAARVNHLSPSALVDRMSRSDLSRLPLLTGDRPDQPARFRSMTAAIAWSYDLLDAAEQIRLQQLAVFTGGFSLAAAATVFDLDEPATLEHVSSLTAKSLLRDEGELTREPRFGMLETIREFGLARLTAGGDEAAICQRHAEWCLHFAEHTGQLAQEDADWLDRLDYEHANLRSALTWFRDQHDGPALIRLAGALSSFWEERGHYGEGRHWLETAIALDPAPSPHRLTALTAAGTLAWFQADYGHAIQRHEEALSLARRLGDREQEALALNNLGVQALELAEFDQAAARFEACLAIVGNTAPSRPAMFALHNLGQISRMRFDSAAAAPSMELALAFGRELGEHWMIARALNGLGFTALDLGENARAVELHREALALGRQRGNLADIVDSIEGLARIRTVTGEAAAAARLFGAADALRGRIEVPLEPLEREYYEPSLRLTQEALGDEAFATAWAAGQSLSTDDGIAEALSPSSGAGQQPGATGGHPDQTKLGLTERELEILRLLATGYSNNELGQLLFISPATAARHVSNIYSKLGVNSRSKATAYAHQHGLG